MTLQSVFIVCLTIHTTVIFHAMYSDANSLDGTIAANWHMNGFQEQPRSRLDLQSVLLDFHKKRNDLLNSELSLSFGHDIRLSADELRANKIIMDLKERELNQKEGQEKSWNFNPSHHVFEVLDSVKQSELFKLIRKMPKGGILHIHDMAMVSVDFLVSLTYWKHLWQRSSDTNQIMEFRFRRMKPTGPLAINEVYDESENFWRLVSDVRAEMGATTYDGYVRSLFTLYDDSADSRLHVKDSSEVWASFSKKFIHMFPMLMFLPARKAYYKQALKEFHEDGAQYVEFRGSVNLVRLLNCPVLNVLLVVFTSK